MENSQELDVTTLPGYLDVRNLVYKLLAEQLMQPPLLQQLGYDLGNCIWNMDYDMLSEKHRKSFDAYVVKLLSNSSRLSILTTDLLQSEEELIVFRSKYAILKGQFDKITQRPDLIPNVTEVQVMDEHSNHYTESFMVRRLYYSEELSGWFVEADKIEDRKIRAIFKYTQLGKI